jgi:hypothetical protein
MNQPTASDLRLLHTILRLTEEQSGQPPTLSEIAVALGLQTSSRGNVQRQLNKLKPRFVNWNASARSLYVTDAGREALGLFVDIPEAAEMDYAPGEDILPLLASGLTRLHLNVSEGEPVRAPYPEAWQRGMNMLAAECIQRGVAPPSTTMVVLDLCRKPLLEWPIRFASSLLPLDLPLLEDEQPTELCRELAVTKGDAEMEICEQMMLLVLKECQARRRPDAYVAFRRYLIDHPVVGQKEQNAASFDDQLAPVGPILSSMYEPVPQSVIQDGAVLLCGHCGWTLERQQDGTLRCGDRRCAVLTANFTRGTEPLQAKRGLYRVRRAIRRYIVAPGKYELRAAERIWELGVECALWPAYDAYDLRVVFADGTAWAVDIKDWGQAHRLARKLQRIPSYPGAEYRRAIYAIPDERLVEGPEYITLLRNRRASEGVEVMSISELISEVAKQSRASRAHGSASTNGGENADA